MPDNKMNYHRYINKPLEAEDRDELPMLNDELIDLLRAVIREEMQPINERLVNLEQGQQAFRQEMRQELQQVNKRLDKLEQGQKKLQKDVTTIKKELSAVWDDIKRLDNRLSAQEERAVR